MPLKDFAKPSVIVVFGLVALWNLLISGGKFLNRQIDPMHPVTKALVDTLRELRDVNLDLQMRLYQPITWRAIPLKNEYVRLVYIDDQAHWNYMYGNIPTDRKQLAKLILHAAQLRTRASVIGIDVELLKPLNPEGDDPRRTQPQDSAAVVQRQTSCRCSQAVLPTVAPAQPCLSLGDAAPGPTAVPYPLDCDTPDLSKWSDNEALAKAIRFATNHGVPVILGSVLYRDLGQKEDDPASQLPPLYSLDDLDPSKCIGPRCTGFGYINLPNDKRQISVTLDVRGPDGRRKAVDSFAYKIAKAAKSSDNILSDPEDATPGAEVFGTFLPELDFAPSRIDFAELANATYKAMSACNGHVVLIGGRWRAEQGRGEPVDQHLSPAGEISGVALHGTYIEALLAHQTSHEWSFWPNVCLDIALGLLIFYAFGNIQNRRRKALWLIIGMISVVLIAWFSMGLFNRYLDFLFPIELYFVHILVEMLGHKHHSPSGDSHVSEHQSDPSI
ncbi:CHASE2 domain-containing protein [Granulicella aggregans]|uniref:CHASE2 domain-containing protein n=1 Tax=Granulicella aggregans TaxID=474949 RepID=UPI0021DFDE8F|nr:CHASE2 domain-containing protein [Granulicella aggregans]